MYNCWQLCTNREAKKQNFRGIINFFLHICCSVKQKPIMQNHIKMLHSIIYISLIAQLTNIMSRIVRNIIITLVIKMICLFFRKLLLWCDHYIVIWMWNQSINQCYFLKIGIDEKTNKFIHLKKKIRLLKFIDPLSPAVSKH